MSYEQKLMQMKKLLKKNEAVKEETPELPKRQAPPAPAYEDQWLSAGLVKEQNDFGIVYKRVVTYGAHHLHGSYKLSDLRQTMEQWATESANHPLCPDPAKPIVFFDTETTGLKGAGTLIFLLGFMEEAGDGFRLTQYVLPGPDHEAAFLYASRLWDQKLSLVMYNGKSFDMPQVETRWTMNRNYLPPLVKHDAIDLLHGSRRIWKDELDSFKLTAIEQSQLGFFRNGDIPGHMAPIIYQDAVKNGNAELLMKVLAHNEWDILSLVTLYIRSTDLLLHEVLSDSAISATNIGKWYADLKSFAKSRDFLERVVAEHGLRHPLAHYHFGFALKRDGHFEEAVKAFEVASEHLRGRERIIALGEMAKLFEHRLRDLERALASTERAQVLLNKDPELARRFRERMKEEFGKREIRLLGKIFPGQAQ
ncbi:ribonuclease H-like domain-containing protein [Sporosarcina sp. Te-1]|uniref:ribonuclease H-like domain-containing protein n=1 Tax=Sporosarcina sp. Te-1 TaxID=2818390 RepID=UPI001A9E6FEA|nr:ribonuclease H-like domain-containing protein [Sporosarcina sp. Te-1]QTD42141.1 ribonuclease H-like domain-containing protein [Sporosarcina sp. Te-1]